MPNVSSDALRWQEPTDNTAIVRQLNSLLRGEISAAETYRMALEKLAKNADTSKTDLLRQIQQDHGRAAQDLRQRITELGATAADSSGAWGTWAKTVQGTMDLFGDSAALTALKEGEAHGLRDYQDALKRVDPASATLIDRQLIPAQQRHLTLLAPLIGSKGTA